MVASESGTAAGLGEALLRAIGAFARAVRRERNTPPSARAEALALLAEMGEVNVAALAQRRQVKHQTMRTMVAQMECAGLVARRPDPADGRSQLVALLPAGRAELARAGARHRARIDAMIADGLTVQEQAVLRAAVVLLDRLSGSTQG